MLKKYYICSMKYYVYKHIREDKNEPFYIGIGTILKDSHIKPSLRYCRAFRKNNRSKYWNNIVNKTPYTIEIIYESDDRKEIENKEIEFIKLYGRKINNGPLVNLTDGGEGPLKRKYKTSEKTKQLLSNIKSKQLYCYSLNGNFLYTYKNIEIAAKNIGVYKNSISTALNSKTHFVKNCLIFRENQGKNLGYKYKKKHHMSKQVKVISKEGKTLYYDSIMDVSRKYSKCRDNLGKQYKKYKVIDFSLNRSEKLKRAKSIKIDNQQPSSRNREGSTTIEKHKKL